MQIQVTTDNHVQGDARLVEYVEDILSGALERFGKRITRVEAHLGDENSRAKAGGDDKRCVLEARLAGMQPLSVTHHGDTVKDALHGATDKLEKLLDKTLEKQKDHKGQVPFSGEEVSFAGEEAEE